MLDLKGVVVYQACHTRNTYIYEVFKKVHVSA